MTDPERATDAEVETLARPMQRSAEEFAMREAISAWGRARWPRARVVHELVVADRRIDMAFIEPDNLVGVEIKSSRDTLDRLESQIRTFCEYLPCVVAALAPKWGTHGIAPCCGADDSFFCDATADPAIYGVGRIAVRRQVTVQMLRLLWAAEARAVAARTRVSFDKRLTLRDAIPMLARALTGDEIVREVCRELRARDAFPRHAGHPTSDPPIIETETRRGGAMAVDVTPACDSEAT